MTDLLPLAAAVAGIFATVAVFAFYTAGPPAPRVRPPRRRALPPPPDGLEDQEPSGLDAAAPVVRCYDCGFELDRCGCREVAR